MLVDSHCHLDRLDLAPYGGDFPAFMAATRAAGITHMLCVCIDLEHYPAMLALVFSADAPAAYSALRKTGKPVEAYFSG